MSPTRSRCLGCVAVLALFTLAEAADAQRVRYGYRFGGVRVSGPAVTVRVPTPPWVAPRRVVAPAPFFPVPPPFFPGSFRVSTPAYTVEGRVSSAPVTTVTEPTPAVPTPAVAPATSVPPSISPATEASLLSSAAEAVAVLHNRLNGFANGERWQAYLMLDKNPAEDAATDEERLRRFGKVAGDSGFAVIADLPEFAAASAALQAVADRGFAAEVEPPAPPQPIAAAEAESLPTPTPDAAAPTELGDGRVERSVLKP